MDIRFDLVKKLTKPLPKAKGIRMFTSRRQNGSEYMGKQKNHIRITAKKQIPRICLTVRRFTFIPPRAANFAMTE